eukprot:15461626-Alexandrium_andersonii.AAC.1
MCRRGRNLHARPSLGMSTTAASVAWPKDRADRRLEDCMLESATSRSEPLNPPLSSAASESAKNGPSASGASGTAIEI